MAKPSSIRFDRFGLYRRGGVLVAEGYSDTPDMLYCPSIQNNHPWIKPGGENGNFRGWFEKGNIPAGTRHIVWSYVYREAFTGKDYQDGVIATGPFRQELNIERDSPDMVIFSDGFADTGLTGTGNVDAHHKTGYNFARLDGSGSFHTDPAHVIRDLNDGNPGKYHQNEKLLERVFETLRHGELVAADDLAPE